MVALSRPTSLHTAFRVSIATEHCPKRSVSTTGRTGFSSGFLKRAGSSASSTRAGSGSGAASPFAAALAALAAWGAVFNRGAGRVEEVRGVTMGTAIGLAVAYAPIGVALLLARLPAHRLSWRWPLPQARLQAPFLSWMHQSSRETM